MYAPGTKLRLKEQRPPDEETKEKFPYNEVEVINESPIGHAHQGQYVGEEARGVILQPLTNFGGTLDEPFGKIRELYDVYEEAPQVVQPGPVQIPVTRGGTREAGETPEDVFAREAPGERPEDGQSRGRTSPLPDPNPKTGPLG